MSCVLFENGTEVGPVEDWALFPGNPNRCRFTAPVNVKPASNYSVLLDGHFFDVSIARITNLRLIDGIASAAREPQPIARHA